MEENWYVLLIAILSKVDAEQAYKLYSYTSEELFYPQNVDLSNVIKIRNELSINEFAKRFKVNRRTVMKRIKRYKEKVIKEYMELAEKLYNQGFTITECIDLITDMAKAEHINETLKVS
jgi:predicted DNA-binding protein YlxM (UPF0122 family)